MAVLAYLYIRFVQHSVDEISLGQTVTLLLEFETMHALVSGGYGVEIPWVEENDAEDGCQPRCIRINYRQLSRRSSKLVSRPGRIGRY